jgi:hypothetical protein
MRLNYRLLALKYGAEIMQTIFGDTHRRRTSTSLIFRGRAIRFLLLQPLPLNMNGKVLLEVGSKGEGQSGV